ncbi:MAG: tRNA (adenosine(37)-N6)-dimethylallyltransferase MiaA [Candidatus Aminicenantaceae bacterium]
MESKATQKKQNLLILCGPTGVGKSTTAVKIAKAFNGEVISCDSMQVYRGFDVGTDKIPSDEREGIPHYLLDIVDSSVQFTAADFVRHALTAVRIIQGKKKLPIITGGTGLYLKALIDGLFPEGKKDPHVRRKLEEEAETQGLEHLQKRLNRIDPVYARKIGKNDGIRIIRALEVYHSTKKPISDHFSNTRSYIKGFHVLRIGLKLEREELYKRIETRVDQMFAQGIVEEIEALLKSGVDETSPPFRALGYKHVLSYLKKELSLEETIDLTKRDTRHYAKRQMTWFRKMGGIYWFSPHDFSSLADTIKGFLAK